ncbi:MAG: hypothetical protein AAFY29_03215 [Pseudomonadota bacterium]
MKAPMHALTALVLSFFLPSVYAQETDTDHAGKARAAMKALRPMAGEWVAQSSLWRDGGWTEPETDRATINFMLNDLALRERFPERSQSSVRMETTIQFDQYRDIYRLMALDDSWGNMDVYEGEMVEPGKLVFTNIRPGTFALGKDGEEYAFKLTFSIESRESHSLLVEISTNRGKSWTNFQKIERTRLG